MKPIKTKKKLKKNKTQEVAYGVSAKQINKRVPRPQGLTYLCQSYNQSQSPQTKEKIINNYITYYLNNNPLVYDAKTKGYRLMNIQELATFLNLDEITILRRINKNIERMGNLFSNNKGQFARAIFLQALFWGTESRSLAAQQLAILMASQGSKYVPYVSSEVNKAVANLIAANKPVTDLLKLFSGGQNGTQPMVPLDSTEEPNKGTYITSDQAIKMINESNHSMLNDDALLDAKLLEMGTIPEVNPNMQGGDILDATSLTQSVPSELEKGDKDGHSDKRIKARFSDDIEDAEEFIS